MPRGAAGRPPRRRTPRTPGRGGAGIRAARADLLLKPRERARSLGLTLEQVVGATPAPVPAKGARGRKSPADPKPGAGMPIKHRSREGGTWTGRGRKPNWLTAADAAGSSAEDFPVPG